jgi:predicted secreted protein
MPKPSEETVSSDIEKLQEIMATLPDTSNHPGMERREYSLTKGDVLLIFKIAKVASSSHVCPFEEEESDVLLSIAKNANKTQRLASSIIIMGTVSAVLSGLWFAIKHVCTEWEHLGGSIK